MADRAQSLITDNIVCCAIIERSMDTSWHLVKQVISKGCNFMFTQARDHKYNVMVTSLIYSRALYILSTFMIAVTCLTPSVIAQPLQSVYGFADQQYDSVSKLANLRARYYDPETGTFLSKDPLGVAGAINAYQYCGNDPVDLVDPTGLFNSQLFWPSLGGVAINGVGALGAYTLTATGFGAVVGAPAAVYTSYQFGANLGNLIHSTYASASDTQAAGPTGPIQTVAQSGMLTYSGVVNSS
jgi:RHS repeat-associated protein